MPFPTTPTLDDFNRADENPLSQGGNWIGRATTTDVNMKVLSNRLALDSASFVFGSAIRNLTVTDGEVYVTAVSQSDHLIWLWLRIQQTGASNTHDGYLLEVSSSLWSIYVVTNGIATRLGTTFTQTFGDGDSIGFEAVGTSLRAYYKPPAGVWTQIQSRVDATYTTGKIGIATNSPNIRFDNFGGGTPPTTTGTKLLDDFNRVDGAIGSNWMGTTSSWTINTNRLSATNGAFNKIEWAPATFTNNAEVAIDIAVRDIVLSRNRLTLTLASGFGYEGYVKTVSSTQDRVTINRIDSGGAPEGAGGPVVTIAVDTLVSIYPGYSLAATADGKVSIYGIASNGGKTLLLQATDSTYRGAFKVGFYTESTAAKFDNFRAGALIVGGALNSKIKSGTTWIPVAINAKAAGVFGLTAPRSMPIGVVGNPGEPVPPPGAGATVVPTIPTGLITTAGDGTVKLNWNSNPSSDFVDNYQVYRNDVLISAAAALTTTSYTDSGLTNGTTYNYRVSAHNAIGFGAFTVTAVPGTPNGALPPPPPPPPAGAVGAKFHRLAINTFIGTPSVATSAVRDAFIIVQIWRTDLRNQIKAANPNCKVLCYLNISRMVVPDSGGNYSSMLPNRSPYTGYASSVVDPDAGVIARIDASGYAQAALDNTLSLLAASPGWDGVFVDDMNSIGDGYLSDSAWRVAQEANNQIIGPGLRSRGYLAIPNMSGSVGEHNLTSSGWLERQFQYYDGGLDEFYGTWPGGGDQTLSFVFEAFRIMGAQALAGKYYLAGSVQSSTTRYLFTCCSMLMTTEGRGTFFGSNNPYATEEWVSTIHDAANALGLATSGKFSNGGNGLWRRNFQHGFATVNINTLSGSITLV